MASHVCSIVANYNTAQTKRDQRGALLLRGLANWRKKRVYYANRKIVKSSIARFKTMRD
jgi:hypothetical protein